MKINYKKWGIILAIITVLIFCANIILSSLISTIVNNQLENINEKGEINLKVDKITVDIFLSRLNIKGIKIKPDSLYFEKFKLGETKQSTEATFEISKLKLKGFNVFKILLFKEINLKKLEASGIDLVVYKSDKYIKKSVEEESKKDVKLDSIFIKGIHEIGLGEIWIEELDLKIINVQKKDTLFAYTENECLITGVDLEPYKDTEGLFKFVSNNLNINLKKQHFNLKTGHYSLLFDEINYNHQDSKVSINNFSLKPTKNKFELAKSYPFNTEVFDVETKEILIKGVDLDRLILSGEFCLDSVIVDGLKIEILKDQTKPFNLSKRPKFLHQKLKSLEDPIYIQTFLVKNSHFLYQEKLPATKDLMTISIADLNAEISNITSIKDSLDVKKDLQINLKGKLNNAAKFNLDIHMPYRTYNNAFSFSGQVGSASFSDFNDAIFPSLGAKIETGKIDHISFFVNGTPYKTTGKMTMLYHDLSADFFKAKPKHKGEESKTLSWLANSVVRSQNPTHKGRTLAAIIEFERVSYKGFGNLVWKSFASGVINTVNPLGKVIKETKQEKEARKQEKRKIKNETKKLKGIKKRREVKTPFL